MRRARALRRLLDIAGRMAARRVAVVGATALSVGGAVLAMVAGSDRTDALLVLVCGVVVTGVLHGHRQHRLFFGAVDELARRSGTGQPVADEVTETLNRQKLAALALGRLSEDFATATDDLRGLIRRQAERTIAEVEALLRLDTLARAYGRASPTPVRTTHPEAALVAVDQLGIRRPKLAVVCGDAITAAWCALAAEHLCLDTRIVAIDHDAGRVGAARRWLSDLELDGRMDFRHTRLEQMRVQGRDAHWYDRGAWGDLVDIGLLSVIGASPLVDDLTFIAPVLEQILAPDAVVVLGGFSPSEVDTIRLTAGLSTWEGGAGPAAAVLVVGKEGR